MAQERWDMIKDRVQLFVNLRFFSVDGYDTRPKRVKIITTPMSDFLDIEK